ncbi:MAG: hypothetical protein LBQ63_00385 [Deltaproteobacteria bacterium]|nr:hypothetical protein [Deltaproteobacteria bacterium]
MRGLCFHNGKLVIIIGGASGDRSSESDGPQRCLLVFSEDFYPLSDIFIPLLYFPMPTDHMQKLVRIRFTLVQARDSADTFPGGSAFFHPGPMNAKDASYSRPIRISGQGFRHFQFAYLHAPMPLFLSLGPFYRIFFIPQGKLFHQTP